MIYVANWKMQKTYEQSIQFIQINKAQLVKLADDQSNELIIAPSFPALQSISQLCIKTHIKIAAQDCSIYSVGPYTGAVDAVSLQQVGCAYCIVGHSERRALFGETNQQVAQKVQQLLQAHITPIVCVGETTQEYQQQQTMSVLYAQLFPIFSVLQALSVKTTVWIAYEPVWSIGTGLVPDQKYLETVFSSIKQWFDDHRFRCVLLYGGSVNPANAQNLKQIPAIEGFLIGGASLEFETFKKIINT